LYKEQDSLIDAGKWETSEIIELWTQFNSTEDEQKKEELRKRAYELYDCGKAYTPEYHAFQSKYKEALKDRERFFIDYIRNDHSLVGLFVLKNQMQWSRDSSNDSIYTVIYNDVYRSLFPGHSLSKYIEMWIGSRNIKVGGRYVDFSAPDLSGTQHTLSKEIAGKVALIDLWASWCGPCRRLSKSMIPIYEKYKERGFTVVGVARENKRENLEQAVVTDGYPWLNLLELNDENKIWVKYGIENAAGNAILVDRDGTILAIYPTAEEVERILQEKL
jgi:thiol-disulfide isomerase/thioredoxin